MGPQMRQPISPPKKKNRVLEVLEDLLCERQEFLFEENRKDIEAARSELLPASLIERLKMDAKVVEEMAAGLRDVRQLPTPLGRSRRRGSGPTACSSAGCASLWA